MVSLPPTRIRTHLKPRDYLKVLGFSFFHIIFYSDYLKKQIVTVSLRFCDIKFYIIRENTLENSTYYFAR